MLKSVTECFALQLVRVAWWLLNTPSPPPLIGPRSMPESKSVPVALEAMSKALETNAQAMNEEAWAESVSLVRTLREYGQIEVCRTTLEGLIVAVQDHMK
jgi:hypothetical protein